MDAQQTPIYVIPFEFFSQCDQFPRNPECIDSLVDIDSIPLDESLVVLISHCWLRGSPLSEGFDGSPHPDNAAHDKYKLCVEALRKAWAAQAPGRYYEYLCFAITT